MTEDPFAHLHDETYDSSLLAHRATAKTLVNAHGRAMESLDGVWRLTLDPFEEGLRQRWYAYDDAPPAQWSLPPRNGARPSAKTSSSARFVNGGAKLHQPGGVKVHQLG